jgi:DNA (cytosine-5)-methyltransferase 1
MLDSNECSIAADASEVNLVGARCERFKRVRGCLVRVVSLRNGGFAESSTLTSGENSGHDPESEFDLSWLRSRVAPKWSGSTSGAIRAADLFSGCGGLSIGMQEACRALQKPVTFAFASDFDEAAIDVYKENFAPVVATSAPLESLINGRLGARRTRSEAALMSKVGRVDYVVAGPPCQGHSDLNNHTRRDDPKNSLILRVARFAELFNPENLLIENVQGIQHDKSGSLSLAISALRRLGYEVDFRVLSADRFGVPQARKRFILSASLGKLRGLQELSTVETAAPRPLSWALGDLVGMNADDVFDSASNHSAVNRRRIDYLFENNLFELPDSQRPPCHRDKSHSYTGVYGRMRWDRPAPTITTGFGSAGQGRFVHPLLRRTLTPHEAARVQFFPDFFRFGNRGRRQLQELIGNAVPSKLAYAVVLNQIR